MVLHVCVVDVDYYLYKIICIYIYIHGFNGSLFGADNGSSLLSGPNIFITCYPKTIRTYESMLEQSRI
jgi:hypothetical protein